MFRQPKYLRFLIFLFVSEEFRHPNCETESYIRHSEIRNFRSLGRGVTSTHVVTKFSETITYTHEI